MGRRYVRRGSAECRRSDIGSGQGRVQDTNHRHRGGGQVQRSPGAFWTMTRVPGGAKGVQM